jgi:hypothetical protein
MMMLLLGIALAKDTEQQVLDAVEELEQEQVKQQAESVTSKVSSIEAKLNYLADQKRCAQGLCPEGWVQPPFEEYAKPGAPETFVPPPPPEPPAPVVEPGTGPLLEEGPDVQGPILLEDEVYEEIIEEVEEEFVEEDIE